MLILCRKNNELSLGKKQKMGRVRKRMLKFGVGVHQIHYALTTKKLYLMSLHQEVPYTCSPLLLAHLLILTKLYSKQIEVCVMFL